MKKYSIVYLILVFMIPFQGLAAYEVDIKLPKSSYVVKINTEDEQRTQQILDKLSEQERISFLQTRSDFLRASAIAFQKIKLGFGFGSVIKSRLAFYREKKEIHRQFVFAEKMEGDVKDTLVAAALDQEENLQARKAAFREQKLNHIADDVILKLLSNLDRNLWNGAPIVSRANEFSMMVALGPQIEMGAAEGKKWGGLLDIGLSLGYNRDQKAMVFQIFRDKEKFLSTQMPGIFIAGVVLKTGLIIANQNKQMTTEGSSFYPPMAPGFSTMTDRSFNAGFSSGLTWPPSPLGDILTYTNSSQRRVWLRISFSPVQKGFIKVRQGFSEELSGIINRFRSVNSAASCEALF